MDPGEGKELSEEIIAEIFDNPSEEPEDPQKGELHPPSEEECVFLNEVLNIKAQSPGQ